MSYSNNVKATLNANVAIGATSIQVVKAVSPYNDPPTEGYLTIMDNLYGPNNIEIISYTGRTDNTTYWTLTGVTRAQFGTADQAWVATNPVFQDFVADDADKSLEVQSGNTVTMTNKTLDDLTNTVGADHVHVKIRNTSGSTVTKGTVLKATGYNLGQDCVEVGPTTATTDIAFCLAEEDILNNANGKGINTGVLHDIDTSSWTLGTVLYSDGAGGLSSTKPATGNYQAVGYVLRQHANNGRAFIEVTEPQPQGGAGATGAGGDEVFFENDQAVTTSYTLTANKNAMTAGPIDINTGVTVTVPTGATWHVL